MVRHHGRRDPPAGSTPRGFRGSRDGSPGGCPGSRRPCRTPRWRRSPADGPRRTPRARSVARPRRRRRDTRRPRRPAPASSSVISSVDRLLPQYTSARPLPGCTRPQQGVALVRRAAAADDRHGQVVADEPGDPLDGCSQAEACRDVLADPRGRRRREGADRRAAARRDGVAEAPVIGAEVVAPARDAVRLVDDEAIDRQPAEVVEEAGGAETLRARGTGIEARRPPAARSDSARVAALT